MDKEIELQNNVKSLLDHFDKDSNREGLLETPKRYVKFLDEFINKDKDWKFTCFDSEGMEDMVIQTNIPFYSLCEHHLAPFHGVGHIAYVPDGKIVGLSKLARTLDYYARNFQNQERITKQVAERLMNELQPKGVAVILKAQHLCMSMRGVKKHDTWTTTSNMTGAFRESPALRAELMSLIKTS